MARSSVAEFPPEATRADWRIGYRSMPLPSWVRPPWKPGQMFAMTDTVAAFHSSTAFCRVFVAGYGGGKTHALVAEASFLAVENLGCTGLVVVPTYPLADDVFRPAWESWLTSCGLIEGRDWTLNQVKFRYDIWGGAKRGGATVLVRTGEHPKRLVGSTVAWAAIDEVALMPRLVYTNVRARVRDPRAKRRALVLVGTPDIGSWLKSFHAEEAPDVEWFRGRTSENPWLDQAYLDGLMGSMDALAAKVYLDGEFVSLSGSAYRSFVRAEYPTGNLRKWTYDPARPVYLTLDNNKRPLCAGLLQRDGGFLQRFDEVTLHHGWYEALADAVHHRLGGVAPPGFALSGDPTIISAVTDRPGEWGGFANVRDQLHRVFGRELRVQLEADTKHPLVLGRLEAVNAALCNARGERRYLVDPRCKVLIDDLEQVECDNEGAIVKPGRGSKVDALRTHHCFAAGTLVDAEGGPCAIESLPAEGRVRTWDGTLTRYVEAGPTLRAAETVLVHLSNGETVRCTPWHQWWTTRGWVEAERLQGATLVTLGSSLSPPPVRSSLASGSIAAVATRGATSTSRDSGPNAISIGSCGRTARAPALHVLSIEHAERADVYCLTVPDGGCFALASGAIVSNSDADGYLLHRLMPPGGGGPSRNLQLVTVALPRGRGR